MFPPTRHSVISSAASGDADTRRDGFGVLVQAYWKPVYKYVRLRWRAAPEEAEDLTQAFFARAFEKRFLDPFDPSRARFRTFLRTCLDGFVANQRQAGQRLKRGGASTVVSFDALAAEGELRRQAAAPTQDFDEYFDREWARSVLALAVERFRAAAIAAGRERHVAVFTRYDLEAPDRDEPLTYADLARELGLAVTDVTNALNAARREFRAAVLECLRELTMSDDEFRAEARRLLGVQLQTPGPLRGPRPAPDAPRVI
jgi:RNA polymerase sigma factor (sigma-70 family)